MAKTNLDSLNKAEQNRLKGCVECRYHHLQILYKDLQGTYLPEMYEKEIRQLANLLTKLGRNPFKNHILSEDVLKQIVSRKKPNGQSKTS